MTKVRSTASTCFAEALRPIVVDTNLMLAAKIRALTRAEAQRILQDYERVSRLEEHARVDHQLGASVNRLHEQVSRFRKQVASENIRLGDISTLRGSLLEILGRLEACAEGEDGKAVVGPTGAASLRLAPSEVIPAAEDRDLFGRALREMVAALSRERAAGEGQGAVGSSLVAYRLEQRELLAFERLAGEQQCDTRLEKFLLAAAALRFRINEEVGEIHAYRSSLRGEVPAISESTRRLLATADWYLSQFSHFLLDSGVERIADDVRSLQLLRMRLMRDYSGLWLVANACPGEPARSASRLGVCRRCRQGWPG